MQLLRRPRHPPDAERATELDHRSRVRFPNARIRRNPLVAALPATRVLPRQPNLPLQSADQPCEAELIVAMPRNGTTPRDVIVAFRRQ